MLKLDLLPAGHGDCLWIEYGDPTDPHRVLIDGGARGTYKRALKERLTEPASGRRQPELMVITHIDADHITGILDLLEDDHGGLQPADVWFNGFRHLPDEKPDTLGPVQGEKLTWLLDSLGLPWNTAFDTRAVVVPDSGDLPRVELAGGLVLTLLAPNQQKLAELKPVWDKEVRKAGLEPGHAFDEPTEEGFALLGAPDIDALAEQPFVEDTSQANGSSIAFLAEFDGRRVLYAGDAHPGLLKSSIRRLQRKGRLQIDAFKLPHHGSPGNVDARLLATLDCESFLFSSNGAYFRHPHPVAVARVIKWGGAAPRLVFNYRTRHNQMWDSDALRGDYGYTTVYPPDGTDGVTLEW